MPADDLSGRVALVTGASRGIGAAIARALGGAGAAVAVNYRERAEAAEKVAADIRTAGGRALVAGADVSKSDEVARLMAAVASGLGPIDILVNNAGIGRRRTPAELTEDEFDATIAANLKSAFLCTQAVIGGMRERGFGRVVNISSGAARGPGGIGVHYNASKAGMEGLTRGYAAHLAPHGITVNAVAPSLIVSEMLAEAMGGVARSTPVGRVGTPEEVADVVLTVVRNAYMTGQTIQVNGGLSFI